MARFAKSKGSQFSNKKVPPKNKAALLKKDKFKSKKEKNALAKVVSKKLKSKNEKTAVDKKKPRRRHNKGNKELTDETLSANVKLVTKEHINKAPIPLVKVPATKKDMVKKFPEKKSKKIKFNNDDKFVIENGKKFSISKNGKKLPWIELNFEENEFMTKYKKAFVKREMVEKLDSLQKSMEEKGIDEKQIAYTMLVQEKKAHMKLKRELLNKMVAKTKTKKSKFNKKKAKGKKE